MGCVSSKQTVSVTPAFDHSGGLNSGRIRVGLENDKASHKSYGSSNHKKNGELSCGSELGESGRASSNSESLSFRLRNLQKYIEGEQVAAGWPAWLSAVAGEAIQGWVPLKADAFEKLEKIGQGTYSSVFRAHELETGRIVALKKVRFDNFEPESVRFMAREILILRRLNHPNVMKLDGLITSRLSCSIYLVFEYMEHDITGLLSCPDVRFSESQIKCYMKQLLSGLEHCHSKGVMHRDIKGSNLLVNNEGILKVGDFGLANFCNSGHRQPLTSRVVTLWYRPPELLLGSTDYGAAVDLWSVGCVFAELHLGKPVLQGRTEVEQLHKIFKLCGSPPDEYWKKSKLPHATLFKPQQPYDSCLHETFKDLPKTAVNLIETLLSVEPYKRSTATSALASEYFTTKPYACDPSSLPKYPPSKEIDAKNREEAKRKKISGRSRGAETKKPARKPGGSCKLAPAEAARMQGAQNNTSNNMRIPKGRDGRSGGEARKPSFDKLEEIFHVKNASQGDIPFSGPLQVSSSSGFAWAKRRKDDASIRSHNRSISRVHINNGLEPSTALQEKKSFDSRQHDNGDVTYGIRSNSRGHDSYEISKRALQKQWSQLERPDSFDASDGYHSQELSLALYQREEMEAKRNNLGFQDQGDKVELSGPLLTQSHRVDELLERHERHIRQAVRKSWFQRGLSSRVQFTVEHPKGTSSTQLYYSKRRIKLTSMPSYTET
ncbi:protein IMPAIRED IN BABA-INDUCED STERILITY 1 isoform X1 [Hevea brasiliensis]|uniref:protein IMPAIRED IN BABA-INDUCED STERILITY 1 isoform X1 n=1 Tax=Hevea brasiliensis TaxID=3981 RepID=UPI0025F5CF4D|nr:protein IMPAIRED IN BABA-INDUCED STERILITY 1 isoform X1 [Hevea brasiliensis]